MMSLVRLTIQCRFWVLRFLGRSEHTPARKQQDKLIKGEHELENFINQINYNPPIESALDFVL